MEESQGSSPHGPAPKRGGIFGVRLDGFGLFTSLLMSLTFSFLTFFLTTFLAIAGIMIYNGLGHRLDYADSYRFISFPAGCIMLAVSLVYFLTLWLRRKLGGE